MNRKEYLDEIREIRRDMHQGCDTAVVHRCRICGGTTSVHYGQPPECDCEPPGIPGEKHHEQLQADPEEEVR